MARGIYKIINIVNNKFYVGSAVDLSRRRTRHFSELKTRKHNNQKLQAAWEKYGADAFIFVVVEELEDGADLLAAEDVWLSEHVGKDYCYNIGTTATAPSLGLCGPLSPSWGRKHTEDAKSKIGAASKARTQSDDERKKRRDSMKGHVVPLSVRAKISATLSGEGNYWYGKKRPEHGQKVSKAIVVTDPAGNVATYPSISALRAELGLKPPTVNRAVKSEKPLTRGKFTGWTFKYVAAADGS